MMKEKVMAASCNLCGRCRCLQCCACCCGWRVEVIDSVVSENGEFQIKFKTAQTMEKLNENAGDGGLKGLLEKKMKKKPDNCNFKFVTETPVELTENGTSASQVGTSIANSKSSISKGIVTPPTKGYGGPQS
eukprot:GHVT01004083.1.p1 GENE.GHVT01004083.1~~GHVT01004083.1.p1  ORF type:complete len:132 (-),score=9.49 GHVT01004083.1:10-405(-)